MGNDRHRRLSDISRRVYRYGRCCVSMRLRLLIYKEVKERMIIRQAKETELAKILELYQNLADVYNGVNTPDVGRYQELWQQICQDERQYLLVAELDGEIIGTLNLTILPNLGHGGQPWAAIDNVAVDPSRRSQGIGAELVAEAGRIAKEHHCYKIVLSSNLARERAHAFYQRLGWKQTHIGFSLDLTVD